jgi:hypothetical protein
MLSFVYHCLPLFTDVYINFGGKVILDSEKTTPHRTCGESKSENQFSFLKKSYPIGLGKKSKVKK